MGRFFSDAVEQGLDLVYYHIQEGSGAKGFQILLEAAKGGDGDAEYFLSRCLSGDSYVWKYHFFPEDDETVSKLIHSAIAHGSAAAVLGAMRCGELTPSVQKTMPFASLKEAWDVVYQKAQGGEPFCQYMIGNTYFWGDALEINGFDPKSFASDDELSAHLREQFLLCVPWFERAFENGVYFAGNNLRNIYTKGKPGLGIAPQPEKDPILEKRGAELGYPSWQTDYALTLREAGQKEEALVWFKKAAAVGQLNALIYVGDAYEEGSCGVAQDVPYALSCFEKTLKDESSPYGFNRVGKLYFKGESGIPRDYARAVQCFEHAHSLKNTWGNDLLALCYLQGNGCQKNPARARELLEEVTWTSPEKNYALGVIYAQGLGVAQDITKGVGYLQKAGSYAPAREELSHYKKGLLGKWKRR